jgi:hypothetical protein
MDRYSSSSSPYSMRHQDRSYHSVVARREETTQLVRMYKIKSQFKNTRNRAGGKAQVEKCLL